MQKFILCFKFLILLLLQNSEHMSVQINGQWIPQNFLSFPGISSFILPQTNICDTLFRKKCLWVSSSIWRLNYSPAFTSKLDEGFCSALHGAGCMARASNIFYTRKAFILMAMTGQMFSRTDRIFFCQQ